MQPSFPQPLRPLCPPRPPKNPTPPRGRPVGQKQGPALHRPRPRPRPLPRPPYFRETCPGPHCFPGHTSYLLFRSNEMTHRAHLRQHHSVISASLLSCDPSMCSRSNAPTSCGWARISLPPALARQQPPSRPRAMERPARRRMLSLRACNPTLRSSACRRSPPLFPFCPWIRPTCHGHTRCHLSIPSTPRTASGRTTLIPNVCSLGAPFLTRVSPTPFRLTSVGGTLATSRLSLPTLQAVQAKAILATA